MKREIIRVEPLATYLEKYKAAVAGYGAALFLNRDEEFAVSSLSNAISDRYPR